MEEKRSQLVSDHLQAEFDAQQSTSEQPAVRESKYTSSADTGVIQDKKVKEALGKEHSSKRMPLYRKVVKNGRVSRTAAISSILALLCILGAVGAVIAYRHLAVVHVTAFQVGPRQDVARYVGGGGIVYASQEFDLAFPFAGRVQEVLVKVGDRVKPKQPLIKLDQAQLDAQLKMAEDNVAAAETYLYSVSNAFPYNPVAVAGAQQDIQEARSEFEMLKSQSMSGSMVSSVNGVVTVINVENGEAFGGNKPLMTVIDPSQVVVRAKIPLGSLNHVSTGMSVRVTPAALNDRQITGKVISIVPQADPQTDTFEVWVEVPNKERLLLPGMSAFVNIQGKTNAFVVPRLAVLNPDYESSVFVIRDGHAYIERVQVIGRDENTVFIDSGVSADQKIVLLPLDVLNDGQAIQITEERHLEGEKK